MDPNKLAKFREGKGKSQGGYNQDDLRRLMQRSGLLTQAQAGVQLSKPLMLHILDGGIFPTNSTQRKKWGLGTGEYADGHFDLLSPAEKRFRQNGRRGRDEADVADHMGKQEDVMKQVATRGRRTNLISTLAALRESKAAGDDARARHQLKKEAKAKAKPMPRERNEADVADHMVRQEHVMKHLTDRSSYTRGVRAGVWLATHQPQY